MLATMTDRAISEVSKQLSWLLRHGAGERKLAMDAAGWTPVDAVLRELRIDRPLLERVVVENNKGRLELDGGRVRACQGHSLEAMPVTREALEASWQPYEAAGSIWHGTNVEAAESILREGILPGGRSHVHLADGTESKVGKRAQVAVLLEVSTDALRAAGRGLFASSNGVVLVRDVPVSCLIGVVGMTREGKANEGRLRSLLQVGRDG